MAKSRRTPKAEQKTLRRIARARAAYTKAEDRIGDLRLRLSRAEQKLAKRAARLSDAEAALAALAAPAPPPAQPADELATATVPSENGVAPASRSRSRRKVLTPEEA